MKRFLIISMLVLIFFMSFMTPKIMAFEPPDYCQYSSIYTDDQNAIVTGPGYLYGILVITDGTNEPTIETHDNITATGIELHPDWVVTTSAIDRVQFLPLPKPIAFNVGLSLDVTIAAGTVSVIYYYRRK